MKEGALVAVVTLGLLAVLVSVVASGLEDAGPLTMARHFPVTVPDVESATALGRDYARCRADFAERNRANYPVAAVLAESSARVCAPRLRAVSSFLSGKGYAADVVARETSFVQRDQDRTVGDR